MGPSICAAVSADCKGTGQVAIGEKCACNADCDGDKKECLEVTAGSMSVGRFCTRRQCDVTDSASCASGGKSTARCCSQLPLLVPTCFNDQISGALQSMGTCSP
jgi:hypothetical protein